MNKKGFMFIETIVMCAILMVALLIIYNSYTSAIAREKERLNYNIVSGELKLDLIKKYLMDKYPEWICETETSCTNINNILNGSNFKKMNEYISTAAKNDIDVANIYKIKELYLIKCSVNKDFPSVSPDFTNFLEAMKDCSNENKYRFVAEFETENPEENNVKFSYAWVEYPYVETEDKK